jgi:ATP-binding cassette subfamily B protein
MYDPTSGQILWDGININKFSPCDLRKMFGVVFQDFNHYELSIKDNIVLGDITKQNDLEAIRKAAEQAGIDKKVNGLPLEYKTVLSLWLADKSTGTEFSGGEWQKIAIARAIIRNACILILDEPTSALDPLAENKLFSQFKNMVDGKTSLIISHRLSSISMADEIVVIDAGKIIENGTHNQLMSNNNLYHKLYKTQMDRYAQS